MTNEQKKHEDRLINRLLIMCTVILIYGFANLTTEWLTGQSIIDHYGDWAYAERRAQIAEINAHTERTWNRLFQSSVNQWNSAVELERSLHKSE